MKMTQGPDISAKAGKSMKKPQNFIHNADISTNPSYYHRPEGEASNSNKYSFSHFDGNQSMYGKRFQRSIFSRLPFLNGSADRMHKCSTTQGCKIRSHHVPHKTAQPCESVLIIFLNQQDNIYRYHFDTCSKQTIENIKTRVYFLCPTFVHSF